MQVWITKYALTRGIFEVEAELSKFSSFGVLTKSKGCHFHFWGNDWHRTREAAIDHAEAMRTARIAKLKKQIARLEELRFG